MVMYEYLSAVSPLHGSFNGAVTTTAISGRKVSRHPALTLALSPRMSGHLADMRVDLLCVEVLGPDEVVIHNTRDWK